MLSGGGLSLMTRRRGGVPALPPAATIFNTRSDSALAGSAVGGFMTPASALDAAFAAFAGNLSALGARLTALGV